MECASGTHSTGGHTKGEVMFQKIVSFFNKHELDLQKVRLLVIDSAPDMTGKVQRLVSRLSAKSATSPSCVQSSAAI